MGKQIANRQAAGSGKIPPPSSGKAKPDQLKHPIFCLRYLQNGFDVSDCDIECQKQLIKKLRQLSQLEWQQIEQGNRHGTGKENIDKGSINPSIPPIVTDDVKLWAIRYNGTKPMIGFRNGPIFHIIWLDHNYTVYNH